MNGLHKVVSSKGCVVQYNYCHEYMRAAQRYDGVMVVLEMHELNSRPLVLGVPGASKVVSSRGGSK